MDRRLSVADQLKLRVIELFNEKRSQSIVAEELQLTRGQVSGIIHRARQKGVFAAIVRPKLRNGAKEAQPKVAKVKRTTPFREKPRMFSTDEMVKEKRRRLRLVQSDEEVTFEQLQTHHCRFSYGEPRSIDFRFCGKPRWNGAPYCEAHCAVCYTPSHPVRSRR